MHRSRLRATRADLDRLPEKVKAELIAGEIFVTPAPSDWHEALLARLMATLHDHLGARAADRLRGSRTEVVARVGGEENVLQPDAVVFPEGTRPTGPGWKAPTPVWVAEVLSPSTADRDRDVKVRLYAAAKVRETWLVDPDTETVETVDLASMRRCTLAKGERATSSSIPGFEIDVGALFAV